jgi:hypothetical protein
MANTRMHMHMAITANTRMHMHIAITSDHMTSMCVYMDMDDVMNIDLRVANTGSWYY